MCRSMASCVQDLVTRVWIQDLKLKSPSHGVSHHDQDVRPLNGLSWADHTKKENQRHGTAETVCDRHRKIMVLLTIG